MNEVGNEVFYKMFVKDKEVTLLTKKTRKEIKVYVCDVQDNGRTFVCWYKNRYGNTDLKRFDMTEYDFCL